MARGRWTQAKELGCSLRTAHRVSAHHVSVKEKQGISQRETGSDLHTRVLAKHGLAAARRRGRGPAGTGPCDRFSPLCPWVKQVGGRRTRAGAGEGERWLDLGRPCRAGFS